VQPVDAGFGREVKRKISILFADWLEIEDNLNK
jgi:hypothetical protein